MNKLLATLACEDVSFGQLAELIEKDTVLAGNVLRLVNSALYGRRGTINSVRHAVSLMGLAKLRNAAMTMSVSRTWTQAQTPQGWSQARFNLHAVATAMLADLLAQRVPVDYPEGAFVAGLLHDLGLLLIAISFPEEFEEIWQLHQSDGRGLDECELEVIGVEHAELSAAALRQWNLPQPIQQAVRFQHHPEQQNGSGFRLSQILNIAEKMVNIRGVTIFADSTRSDSDLPPPPLPDTLGIGDQINAIVEEFEREFESIKDFF